MRLSRATVNLWCLTHEEQKGVTYPVIRRWVTQSDGKKKYERYPVKAYRHLRNDLKELQNFVIRLNDQIPEALRIKQKIEIRHAFIDPPMLDEYYEFLRSQIPTERNAKCEYQYLLKYFLNFFIYKLNLSNPLDWHRNQVKWSNALLNTAKDIRIWNDDRVPSAKLIRNVVIAANRFIKWLHEKRPGEVPPLKFNPISRATFKEHESNRHVKGLVHEPQFIKDDHWHVIKGNLPSSIKSCVMLAYLFGLRRSETLGMKLQDVKRGYLSIERQLAAIPVDGPKYAPLKGRDSRQVPYWFSSPKQAYNLIESIALIHPDTLTEIWKALISRLKLTYSFHDLRHTWITKAMRGQVPRDVQLAAGHKNIETTMRYLHDDRELEDEVFIPGEAS